MLPEVLPEVSEADASGATAAIFARIRRVQGTSVVNLVWRHLACIDGALSWAWPRVEAALPALGAAVPATIRLADHCIAENRLAHGVTITLRPQSALDILRSYERGNSWNLLAMTALAAMRAGSAPPAAQSAVPAVPSLPPVPSMPSYASLDPAVQDLVDRLASVGPAVDSGVRPSLWVHWALWPGLLRSVAEVSMPILASPGFREAHAHLLDAAAGLLGMPPTGPVANPDPIDVAISRFRQRIPELLLIGRVLAAAHDHGAGIGRLGA